MTIRNRPSGGVVLAAEDAVLCSDVMSELEVLMHDATG